MYHFIYLNLFNCVIKVVRKSSNQGIHTILTRVIKHSLFTLLPSLFIFHFFQVFVHTLAWFGGARVYRGFPPSSLQQWRNLGEVVALPPVQSPTPPLAPHPPPPLAHLVLAPVLPRAPDPSHPPPPLPPAAPVAAALRRRSAKGTVDFFDRSVEGTRHSTICVRRMRCSLSCLLDLYCYLLFPCGVDFCVLCDVKIRGN